MDIPRDPWERRRRLYRQLRAVCIGLVATSSGLIALYAEAPLTQILLAVGTGLLLGVILVALVFPSKESVVPSRTRRSR